MKQKITHPENRLGTDSIGKLIAQFAIPSVVLSSYIGLDGVLWSGPLADILTFLLAAGLIAVELKQMRRLTTKNN